ncbi:MAG: AmmeMemoRadiSam system radical SAM enzyme [Proteobacteria bacterium]|nr:AmmeMemoRadiSam system radical SAM enzyme [Pseudomonadota bacterium]
MGRAVWWEVQADGTLQCGLCAHGCCLRDGQRGLCGVRVRREDRIDSLVYGRIVAEHVDPIEKKPVFHVLPGSLSYSIATHGCNFRCLHCQNAGISQVPRGMAVETSGVFRRPEQIIVSAIAGGCRSISYTYVEPTIFFEYAYDCCLLAFENGLKNIFVSNGYMTKEVVVVLAPVLTAINIDLKSFRDAFYKKVCGARVQPVLDTIIRCREAGIWVEVTTLIIPGMNDGDNELSQIASFLSKIDRTIPWHVSGYHPAYQMMEPPSTRQSALERARQIGFDQGLHHVYTGNRPGSGGEDTSCPNCGLLLISRQGFRVKVNRLRAGCCPACSSQLAGIW